MYIINIIKDTNGNYCGNSNLSITRDGQTELLDRRDSIALRNYGLSPSHNAKLQRSLEIRVRSLGAFVPPSQR